MTVVAFDKGGSRPSLGVWWKFQRILYASKKIVMKDRPQRQTENFRTVVDEVCLRDLGYHGMAFTWFNGRGGGAEVLQRIDRSRLQMLESLIGHKLKWCMVFLRTPIMHRFCYTCMERL